MRGSLADIPLLHVLGAICGRRLSGTLEWGRPGDRARAYFSGGRATFVTADTPPAESEVTIFHRGLALAEGSFDFAEESTATDSTGARGTDVIPLLWNWLRGAASAPLLSSYRRRLEQQDGTMRPARREESFPFPVGDELQPLLDPLRRGASVREILEFRGLPNPKIVALILMLDVLGWMEMHTAPPPRRAREKVVSPPTHATASPSSSVHQLLPEEREALRRRILEKRDGCDRAPAHDVLELTPAPTAEQIREQYFRLAKTFHPDLMAAQGLSDCVPAAVKIFARLTEAQSELLANAAAAVPGKEGATHEHRQGIARLKFQEALVTLRRQDNVGAAAMLREITDLDPDNAEYWARLGQALWRSQDVASGATEEALEALNRAIALDPASDTAHYQLGVLLKARGSIPQALAHFRRAAELNPHNIDAVRELRLHEMRNRTTS